VSGGRPPGLARVAGLGPAEEGRPLPGRPVDGRLGLALLGRAWLEEGGMGKEQ